MNLSFETVAPGIHPAIAVVALSVYFKCGLRTKLVAESLAGCDSLIDEIRMRIVRMLDEDLSDALNSLSQVATVLFRSDGTPYEEVSADRKRSEKFMNALAAFASHGGADALSDLWIALRSKQKWLCWAKIMSWAIVITIILESAIVFIGLAFLWTSRPLFDSLLPYSIAPAAICALSCLVPLVPLHIYHDRIVDLRASYNVS